MYIDGAYKYCVKHFTQLFTIHALKNEYYEPAIFCILNNKNTESFSSTLSLVNVICLIENNISKPKTIMVNFERVVNLAIEQIFLESAIVGHFCLTQSWWKKVSNVRLKEEFVCG